MSQATPDHPQGRALAQGTLRKEKVNKLPVGSSKTQNKPLFPTPIASHGQVRMPASVPKPAMQYPTPQSSSNGIAKPKNSKPNGEGQHLRRMNLTGAAQADQFDTPYVFADSLSQIGKTRSDAPLPPTPLEVKSVTARKPVAVTTTESTVGMKAEVFKPVKPAAAAGRAAFVLSEARVQESQTRSPRPRLSVNTYGLNTDLNEAISEIRPSRVAPVAGKASQPRPQLYSTPWMDSLKDQQTNRDYAKEIVEKLNGEKFQKARSEAIEKAKAEKKKLGAEYAGSGFYSMAYDEQPLYSQAVPSRDSRASSRDSRASRGNTTPLSAIGSYFGKVVDKTIKKAGQLADKVESISRPGSAVSFTGSFSFSKDAKDEDKKREERRQKLKATISYPNTGTFESGAEAFERMEREPVRAVAATVPSKQWTLHKSESGNRATSFGDFMQDDEPAKLPPPPPVPRPAAMKTNSSSSMTSKFTSSAESSIASKFTRSRRGSNESDVSFGCKGVSHYSVDLQPKRNPISIGLPPVTTAPKKYNYHIPPAPIPESSPSHSKRASSFYPTESNRASSFYPPRTSVYPVPEQQSGNITIRPDNPYYGYGAAAEKYKSIAEVNPYAQMDREDPYIQSDREEARNTQFYSFWDEVRETLDSPLELSPLSSAWAKKKFALR